MVMIVDKTMLRLWSVIATILLVSILPAMADGTKAEGTCIPLCGPVVEGWELCVRAEKEKVGPCEPIVLFATLKNVSDKPSEVWVGLDELDYIICVEDDKRQVPPYTAWGRGLDAHKADFGRNYKITVKPGERLESRLLANRVFDMTWGGPYKITIKRKFEYSKLELEVVSNTVKVIVSEQNPSQPQLSSVEKQIQNQ